MSCVIELTNYFCDVENEALRYWNNLSFPIKEWHLTDLWNKHVERYLETNYLERYIEWKKLCLSDEWFYE